MLEMLMCDPTRGDLCSGLSYALRSGGGDTSPLIFSEVEERPRVFLLGGAYGCLAFRFCPFCGADISMGWVRRGRVSDEP